MKTLVPIKTQRLSPKRYLELVRKSSLSDNIDKVRFIPPQIGGKGYGAFEVTYRFPVLMEV